MRFVFLPFLLLSLTAFAATGPTAVYQDGDFLRASVNNPNDARTLFEALNLESASGRSGSAKVFQTSDKKAEIYCTQSQIPVGNKFACTISIMTAEMNGTTAVYNENDRLVASMNSVEESKLLFDALASLPGSDGRSGQTRLYQTSDLKAEISCFKSSAPIGRAYGCALSISLK